MNGVSGVKGGRGRAAWIYAAPMAVVFLTAACAGESGEAASGQRAAQASDLSGVTIKRFDRGVYGASGVVQLPDRRVLVAGDDQHSPLEVIDLFGSGATTVFAPRQITRALSASGAGTKALNDVEALTIDPRGHVYAATSHALTSTGVAKTDREQLVRFDVHGNRLENLQVCSSLRAALIELDPVFRTAAELKPRQGGLNIEGLAWDPIHARLLIGFRSPRKQADALVVWLENPDAVFEGHANPVLLPPVRLNLQGEGVRDVTYSPTLNAFIILAGSWRHRARNVPALWSWKGAADPPVELPTPDAEDLKPEGIAEVIVNGARALVVVSDDGNADDLYARGRALVNRAVPSRYVILPFDFLTRAGLAGGPGT